MSEQGHTSGPWTVVERVCVRIPIEGKHISANAYCGTEANARLIASAPDMAAELARLRAERSDSLAELRKPLKELLHFARNVGAPPDVLNRLCDEWVKLTGEWL